MMLAQLLLRSRALAMAPAGRTGLHPNNAILSLRQFQTKPQKKINHSVDEYTQEFKENLEASVDSVAKGAKNAAQKGSDASESVKERIVIKAADGKEYSDQAQSIVERAAADLKHKAMDMKGTSLSPVIIKIETGLMIKYEHIKLDIM